MLFLKVYIPSKMQANLESFSNQKYIGEINFRLRLNTTYKILLFDYFKLFESIDIFHPIIMRLRQVFTIMALVSAGVHALPTASQGQIESKRLLLLVGNL